MSADLWNNGEHDLGGLTLHASDNNLKIYAIPVPLQSLLTSATAENLVTMLEEGVGLFPKNLKLIGMVSDRGPNMRAASRQYIGDPLNYHPCTAHTANTTLTAVPEKKNGDMDAVLKKVGS